MKKRNIILISIIVIFIIGIIAIYFALNKQEKKEIKEQNLLDNVITNEIENTLIENNVEESNIVEEQIINEEVSNVVEEPVIQEQPKTSEETLPAKKETVTTTTTTTSQPKQQEQIVETAPIQEETREKDATPKSVEVEQEESTRFDINDGGYAEWGHLSEEQLKALGF